LCHKIQRDGPPTLFNPSFFLAVGQWRQWLDNNRRNIIDSVEADVQAQINERNQRTGNNYSEGAERIAQFESILNDHARYAANSKHGDTSTHDALVSLARSFGLGDDLPGQDRETTRAKQQVELDRALNDGVVGGGPGAGAAGGGGVAVGPVVSDDDSEDGEEFPGAPGDPPDGDLIATPPPVPINPPPSLPRIPPAARGGGPPPPPPSGGPPPVLGGSPSADFAGGLPPVPPPPPPPPAVGAPPGGNSLSQGNTLPQADISSLPPSPANFLSDSEDGPLVLSPPQASPPTAPPLPPQGPPQAPPPAAPLGFVPDIAGFRANQGYESDSDAENDDLQEFEREAERERKEREQRQKAAEQERSKVEIRTPPPADESRNALLAQIQNYRREGTNLGGQAALDTIDGNKAASIRIDEALRAEKQKREEENRAQQLSSGFLGKIASSNARDYQQEALDRERGNIFGAEDADWGDETEGTKKDQVPDLPGTPFTPPSSPRPQRPNKAVRPPPPLPPARTLPPKPPASPAEPAQEQPEQGTIGSIREGVASAAAVVVNAAAGIRDAVFGGSDESGGPPPPPPPPPPLLPGGAVQQPSIDFTRSKKETGRRAGLLSEIQRGVQLKSTENSTASASNAPELLFEAELAASVKSNRGKGTKGFKRESPEVKNLKREITELVERLETAPFETQKTRIREQIAEKEGELADIQRAERTRDDDV